jgi:pyrroloquinoline quinone biosynthesis protein D
MMPTLRNRQVVINDRSRPILARHARLRFDEVRQRWVILAPERVLVPDEVAVEILQLCDGERSVTQIIDVLAEKYAADREVIGADVMAMLRDLAGKGFLADRQESGS